METLCTTWLFIPCLKFLVNVFIIGVAIISGVIISFGVFEVVKTIFEMIFGDDPNGGDE